MAAKIKLCFPKGMFMFNKVTGDTIPESVINLFASFLQYNSKNDADRFSCNEYGVMDEIPIF